MKNIVNEMNEIISSITSSFNIHLNVNQSIKIDTNSVYFSLEKLSNQLNSSEIDFQSILLDMNKTILVRVSLFMIELLKE